jgi:hypothetical protein
MALLNYTEKLHWHISIFSYSTGKYEPMEGFYYSGIEAQRKCHKIKEKKGGNILYQFSSHSGTRRCKICAKLDQRLLKTVYLSEN